MEPERAIDGEGNIKEIRIEFQNEFQKIKKGNSKNRKILYTIIIPILGVNILCCSLVLGVLSGYIELPHQKTEMAETEIQNATTPGTFNMKSL